jgi:hypothetical protein
MGVSVVRIRWEDGRTYIWAQGALWVLTHS